MAEVNESGLQFNTEDRRRWCLMQATASMPNGSWTAADYIKRAREFESYLETGNEGGGENPLPPVTRAFDTEGREIS